MATTNKQIIESCRIEYNIPFDLIINTFASWSASGYKIKKGEKALFITKIWKPCKKSVVADDGTKTETKKLILVNAAFFSVLQVERKQ